MWWTGGEGIDAQNKFTFHVIENYAVGEMIARGGGSLKVFIALTEDLDSVSSKHMEAHKCL